MRQSRPERGALLLVALILIALGITMGGGATALAQDPTPVNVAGIVVDHGDGTVSHVIVPFEEASISGVELLRRSGLPLLTVEFGGMGEGVCAIEATGCDLSACRARLCQTGDPDSAFWQYVQRGDDGEWVPSPLGASSSDNEDGDVDGWFWTGVAPETPALTLGQIAAESGVDLETYAASGPLPEPVVLTTGDPADDDALGTGSALGGIAVVAGIAVIGGLLIFRSRQAPT